MIQRKLYLNAEASLFIFTMLAMYVFAAASKGSPCCSCCFHNPVQSPNLELINLSVTFGNSSRGK